MRLTGCAVLSMISSASAVTFIVTVTERCTNAPVLARLRATWVGWRERKVLQSIQIKLVFHYRCFKASFQNEIKH